MSKLTDEEIQTKRAIKSDTWVIDAAVHTRHKVVFEKPVTADMAAKLFMSEEYEDIIDEEVLEVGHVTSVEPYGE